MQKQHCACCSIETHYTTCIYSSYTVNTLAIVPAAGCTYLELLFRHKNLENIQGKDI